MNIFKLAAAAALAFGTMSVASAPVAAAGGQPGEHRGDRDRGEIRGDRDRGEARGDRDRREYRGNRGNHYGWRNNRGRHRGWYNRRVCRTIWRHGHRQRVCRYVRYRRR
jgi:hypothetical protein